MVASWVVDATRFLKIQLTFFIHYSIKQHSTGKEMFSLELMMAALLSRGVRDKKITKYLIKQLNQE